jgi:hypothetical protein
MNSNRTPERVSAFCAALAETCNVGKACAAVKMSRTAAYEWRESDPDFAAAWDRALKIGVSALEDEAHRRAFEGYDEPVFHQGAQVGAIRKASDTLAIFLLKAHAPEKYRENSKLELAGSLQLTTLSDDELEAEIAALAATVGHNALAPAADPQPDDDASDLV